MAKDKLLYRRNHKVGNYGEHLAEKFLLQKGLVILKVNVVVGKGEIDILARDGVQTVFVEVKTRTSEEYGSPFTALTPQKCYQLQKAAVRYCARYKISDYRFDVIGITLEANGHIVQIEYEKDFFLF